MSRTDIASQTKLGRRLSRELTREGSISVKAFDRAIAAVDASHYMLTPSAVVTPSGLEEVARLLRFASAAGEAITFRSGGTSLSGQASTRGILVDTRRHFRDIEILDEGARIRVGPGATVRQVNARLARLGRKLGPDPASEIACTIGGVIANNSSGMACGTAQNAYRTLESAVIVLASGTVVDSSRPDADERLREHEPYLWEALRNARARLLANPAAAAEVKRQFSIKNTMGYGLNSLLDHSSPIQMLAHLLVGSEGTLGFVAEAVFATVPLHSHAATSLLVFDSLDDATRALVPILDTHPATVELMDAPSLRAAALDPASAAALPELAIDEHSALLLEYQASNPDELAALIEGARELLDGLALSSPANFTTDPTIRDSLWKIRKGLYATVAGARPSGTTALLEDIAVPVAALSDTCAGLAHLFRIHGYGEAVIFGHAKDGNLHFLITEDFGNPANLERYRAFTENMVDLVLSAGGTLKAEHGTGKIMAPFVARQYGPYLYQMMRDLKRAFDPAGVLNPNTILTDDPLLHLKDLKSTPSVESEVDRCVECGYCEPVCPSKDLTTTPRQRIVARRALAEAERRGQKALAKQLRRAQDYAVIETCAVDGMCQTACPVLINTGDLVRRLRSENVGLIEQGAWQAAGKAWEPINRAAATALTLASAVPSVLVSAPNVIARVVAGSDVVPLWSKDLPVGGARRRRSVGTSDADVVFFQACVGSMFGPADGRQGSGAAFASLAAKAGLGLLQPAGIDGLCCGTPWKSKGMSTGYGEMIARTLPALWEASNGGQLPIVCDNSSCSEGLKFALEAAIRSHPNYRTMRVVDAVDFVADQMLGRLDVEQPFSRIVVHPTCSSARSGTNPNLLAIAGAIAYEVTIPDDWGCCAFAGDRGMLHPELTASATAREAAAVGDADAYVSSNRTCEIGMTRATGRTYVHVLEVLDDRSKARRL